MKRSSRWPSAACATISSAPPLPYISAVSIKVMPSSIPSRTAAASSAIRRRFSPMCQVPWPSAGTRSPPGNVTIGKSVVIRFSLLTRRAGRSRRRGVSGAADRQQLARLVRHIDIDDTHQPAAAPYGGSDDQRGVDRRPQIIDAEIHRWQWPAQQHHQRVIAGRVDDRCDRAAVPLAAAAPALEFGLHRGAHYQLLLNRLGAQHRQVQQLDECRLPEAVLDLVLAERQIAHGTMTSLPKTWRFSNHDSASTARSRGYVASTTALSGPDCTRSSNAAMSSRAQPLEPRICSSKVQMKRMSSGGS